MEELDFWPIAIDVREMRGQQWCPKRERASEEGGSGRERKPLGIIGKKNDAYGVARGASRAKAPFMVYNSLYIFLL